MHFLNTIQKPRNNKALRIKILVILNVIACLVLSAILIYQNRDKVKQIFVKPIVIENFDEIMITDKMRRITEPDGAFWIISYESNKEMSFSGIVGYTTKNNEQNFAILTHDILITNGDFSNPFIIEIMVAEHRYRWISWHVPQPSGSISLLHAIPMNEKINQQLQSIRTGDAVVIKGYDIYRVESFDRRGNYLSYWQDDGCNTLLITDISIYPGADSRSTDNSIPR